MPRIEVWASALVEGGCGEEEKQELYVDYVSRRAKGWIRKGEPILLDFSLLGLVVPFSKEAQVWWGNIMSLHMLNLRSP